MSDEQEQVYKEDKDQDISNTGSDDEGVVCEKCGKNPCVCPKVIDDATEGVSIEEGEQEEKKPPKVRWI